MTSGIEWTEDTWNPLTGCSIASQGCTNCYAAREAAGRLSGHAAYKGLAIRNATTGVAEFTGEVRLLPDRLGQPISWKRPRLVFVNSMSDLFHPGVPTDYIAQVYAVMAVAHRHIFQVLTKRPKRRQLLLALPAFQQMVRHYVATRRGAKDAERLTFPLANVWEGVSVEDQANAWRLDSLAITHAAVRWVSAEPLLGDLDLRPHIRNLDWVVVGGESGPRARPMHPRWATYIRDVCEAHAVPFLFKQWGEWAPGPPADPRQLHVIDLSGRLFGPKDPLGAVVGADGAVPIHRPGKRAAGRQLDGVTHDGYPYTENAGQLAL